MPAMEQGGLAASFPDAHRWATALFVLGDQDEALRIWRPSTNRDYAVAANLAAGWVQAALAAAESLGVPFERVWDAAGLPPAGQ